jgi:two-component system cell cycle sensor histidine kinase/response regulator CckA
MRSVLNATDPYPAETPESIRQLVGGIGHDFNNLLVAIMSFSILAQQQLQKVADHEQSDALLQAMHDVEQIVRATERATSLTSQLLQFGQQDAGAPATVPSGTDPC